MSVDSTDLSGRTPLLQAVQSKHPDVIEVILTEGAVDLSQGSANSMALHLAAWSGYHICVEVCIEVACFRMVPLTVSLIEYLFTPGD